MSLSPEVVAKMKHYVYLYINPINDSVFYVGKGKGQRAFSHLSDNSECEKVEMITTIRNAGLEPRIEILVHGLDDEDAARKIEAALIDLIGKEKLTNRVAGYGSRTHGRMTIEQVRALYHSAEAEISEKAILFRISRLYRHTMNDQELYDATRGIWKVGKRRENVRYAMAVYEGVIREVYEIAAWVSAGTTLTTRRDYGDTRGKFEFVGRIADSAIRDKYRYKSARKYIKGQAPFIYVDA